LVVLLPPGLLLQLLLLAWYAVADAHADAASAVAADALPLV